MAGLMNRKRPDNGLTAGHRLFSASLTSIPLHHDLSNDLSAAHKSL
jgi:hypothetical protein